MLQRTIEDPTPARFYRELRPFESLRRTLLEVGLACLQRPVLPRPPPNAVLLDHISHYLATMSLPHWIAAQAKWCCGGGLEI